MDDTSSKHAVITGPTTGTVRLADGRTIDVTAEALMMDSLEEAQEVAEAISAKWHAEQLAAAAAAEQGQDE